MLQSHFHAVESALLVKSGIAAGSGHPTHKGSAREAFVEDFLDRHLSKRIAITSGEIIDCSSKPGDPRNNIDLILYKPEYPRLDLGGDLHAVLAEAVVATIEVKSELTSKELDGAMAASLKIKRLNRHVITSLHVGYQPPSVLSFVVAYKGPASMETIQGWIKNFHTSKGIPNPEMGASLDERVKVPSPTIDGVFILGKGFVAFDNCPLSYTSDEDRRNHPNLRWLAVDLPRGSLLYLFLLLTQAVSGFSASWLDPMPYLSDLKVAQRTVSPW